MCSENYTHVAKENSLEVNIRVVSAALVLFRSCLILQTLLVIGLYSILRLFCLCKCKKAKQNGYILVMLSSQSVLVDVNVPGFMSRRMNESVVFNLCFPG